MQNDTIFIKWYKQNKETWNDTCKYCKIDKAKNTILSNDSCKYCKETHCQMEHVKYCKKKKKKKLQSEIIHVNSVKIDIVKYDT